MIDRDVIEAIRERVDIVEVISQTVTLRKKGGSHMGLCPFHDEKSPSFSVVAHKGIFHCFGCGASGDVFKFLMQSRGLSFMEVVKELGESVGIQIEERELSPEERQRIRVRSDLHEICDLAAKFFHGVLMTRSEGAKAREYLARRGMSQELITKYRLGFAPDSWSALLDFLHREGVPVDLAVKAGLAKARGRGDGAYDLFRSRVIIPIFDDRGRVVAFGGRILGGTETTSGPEAPKYVNSPETPVYQKSKVLYGLFHARADVQKKDRLLVVEGYFDVLSLHQAGFKEAVATCGTSLTPEHLRLIRRLTGTVVAQFDEDEAGMRAATRSLEMFLSAGIEPRRLDLGEHKDPDEFVQGEGAEAFEELLGKGEPLFELVLRRAVQKHGMSPQGKQQVIDELVPMIRHIQSGTARRVAFTQRVAAALMLSEQVVEERVGGSASSRPDTAGFGARWKGNALLNRLLLLLIHAPAEVAQVVAEADPTIITDRQSALHAIAMLLQGRSLPEVLGEVGDPDLERVLMVAATKGEIVVPERSAAAARQILARLERAHVDAELAQLRQALSRTSMVDDPEAYRELATRKTLLSRRRQELIKVSGTSR